MKNWFDFPYLHNDHYKQMMAWIQQERAQGVSILPSDDRIFAALQFTPFDHTRVVLVGQDPYPTKGHAIGLAFSVASHTKPLPRSLENIFKELADDLQIKKTDGNLEGWARQGVLLLNATLTVVEGAMNSHRGKGWEQITSQILNTLNIERDHLVFILWGKDAQKLGKKVHLDATKHLIIESVHPSPLSAHNGFFGSKPFSKTNQYLREHRIQDIDWSL